MLLSVWKKELLADRCSCCNYYTIKWKWQIQEGRRLMNSRGDRRRVAEEVENVLMKCYVNWMFARSQPAGLGVLRHPQLLFCTCSTIMYRNVAVGTFDTCTVLFNYVRIISPWRLGSSYKVSSGRLGWVEDRWRRLILLHRLPGE